MVEVASSVRSQKGTTTSIIMTDDQTTNTEQTTILPKAKRQKTTKATTAWKVYPPKSYANCQQPFTIGDTVFVRPKSAAEKGQRGRILQVDPEKVDRYQIQWEQQLPSDSSEQQSSPSIASVARKRLLPVNDTTSTSLSATAAASAASTSLQTPQVPVRVIVTATTHPFRQLAASHTIATDHVLELGCSTGETAAILWRYSASYVGLDTSSNMIQTVNERMTNNSTNNSCCFQLDALQDPAQAVEHACQYSPTGPTVIYLDIGGNREEAAVIRMVQWILESFLFVRLIVIKSKEVHQAITIQDNQCDDRTGEFAHGHGWFQDRLQVAVVATLPKHPLQAPKKLSPKDNTTPICRYYNYFQAGCAKGEDRCPYDHEHCHLCLKTGHIARQCPLLQLGGSTEQQSTSS
jgi:SAM-dependent methyltransferase